MSRLEGKVLVAQGGGPTHVINQSVVGVALEARKFTQQVADTPSSGLLSTRDKPNEEYCARMFKVMQAHDIRYFFYVGGNDSSDTVRIVNEQAKAADYELRAIHIPKTIDNDLMENDHCPGYGSAARYVAQSFMGVNLDNRALKGVYIGVVMGRH
ncbi:MAG: 6-phosphofructokinase, partial [Luteolibacter sp.]